MPGCVVLLAAGAAAAQAPFPGAQEIIRADTQVSAAGPAEWFTGRVRVDPPVG
jgi:hypothetical protein